jgi:SNF2 family DNA or RNA helicase
MEARNNGDIVCPVCEHQFAASSLIALQDVAYDDLAEEEYDAIPEFESDSLNCVKISTLIQDLLRVRQDEADVKSIIFSQWFGGSLIHRTSMLRLVEATVIKAGFGVVRLDGSMSRQARLVLFR